MSEGGTNSVIICPGGAYGNLAMVKEGSAVADGFEFVGSHAFV